MRLPAVRTLAVTLFAALGCQSLAPRPSVAQLPASATSQGAVRVEGARIITTATEEVELAPDRAMLTFSVETRAKTAGAAGAENARIQSAVLDTLRRLGIGSAQLRTLGFSLNPEYQYPRDGTKPLLIGYQAQNSIQVEVRTLTAVGTIIDAGLAKGATNVGSLRFFASSNELAFRDALRRAVTRARADAETIAESAGGIISGVIEIRVLPSPSGRGELEVAGGMAMRSAQAMDVATPVEGGVLKVSVSIEAKFGFVSK